MGIYYNCNYNFTNYIGINQKYTFSYTLIDLLNDFDKKNNTMPATSQAQRGLIFSKRNQYKTKKNTPKKWKWIWDDEWENKGKLPKYKKSRIYDFKTFNEKFSK